MDPITISAAITGAASIIKLIQEFREEGQRTGAWTPEHEAQFDEKVLKAFDQSHWNVKPISQDDSGQ